MKQEDFKKLESLTIKELQEYMEAAKRLIEGKHLTEEINTVGKLKLALSIYPDEMPIQIEYSYLVSEETGMDTDYDDIRLINLETRLVITR